MHFQPLTRALFSCANLFPYMVLEPYELHGPSSSCHVMAKNLSKAACLMILFPKPHPDYLLTLGCEFLWKERHPDTHFLRKEEHPL